jgi:hypothetical protein
MIWSQLAQRGDRSQVTAGARPDRPAFPRSSSYLPSGTLGMEIKNREVVQHYREFYIELAVTCD